MTAIKTAIKTTLIVGTAALTKECALVKTASAKLDQRIQVLGMSVLAHVAEHHNITLFNDLLDSMGKGHRKTAMVDWALKFGTVSQNVDKEGKVDKEQPFKWDKSKTLNLVGAEEMPWFECKPEKLDEVLDFGKLLAALIKKASKPDAKLSEGSAELLAQIKAIAPVTK